MSNDAEDQEKARAVFRDAIELLEGRPFDYAVAGGVATDHWIDRADFIADVDLVVPEADTPAILECFGSRGFDTAEMEHSWLHKTFKDGVTVDLIFELKNGTRFDESFKAHRSRGELFGTVCYVMSAEDQVAALAGTIARETIGRHWYNVIDLMSNNDLDWDYVLDRSEGVARKMLSVVHFALAEQVPVEKGVIERLTKLADAAQD